MLSLLQTHFRNLEGNFQKHKTKEKQNKEQFTKRNPTQMSQN